MPFCNPQLPAQSEKLQKTLHRIALIKAEIENIRTLPYYSIFNREDERQADLAKANRKLEQLKQRLQLKIQAKSTC